MLFRDKLRNIDIGISELSQYLNISRPTLYKYIELYEKRRFKDINSDILKLFNYIWENELIGKNNVINFILKNIVHIIDDENENLNNVIKYLKSNPNSKKSNIINFIATSSEFDDIIFFLCDVLNIYKKSRLKDEEQIKINIYKKIKEEIKNEKNK